jgi:hypothetical protein
LQALKTTVYHFGFVQNKYKINKEEKEDPIPKRPPE